jgi:hypothetical protein
MKKERLAREIQYELGQLAQLASVVSELLAVPASDRKPWHAAAGAKYVADLFMGLENLCKRRYAFEGSTTPEGADSHKRIVEDFLQADGLGKQLSAEVSLRLKKYLRFRHRFVHGYGLELTWDMVEEPLRLLPQTVEVLTDIWAKWLSRLPENAT